MIEQTSEFYQQLKIWLIDGSGLSKDALHIYAGLALFFVVRLGLRRPAWAAWLGVVIVAIAGEWLDVRGEHLRGALAPDQAHWHDIWNTSFWPSILTLADRWWPQRADDDAPMSGENAERSLEQA